MVTALGLVLAWYSQHLVLLGTITAFAYLLWTCMVPTWMWKLRKVPGGRGTPILGHLVPVIKHDWLWFLDMLYKQFHDQPAFQVWRATMPGVVIRDPEVARRVSLRYADRMDLSRLALRNGHDKLIWDNGLIAGRGKKWRKARKAFESALIHPKGLSAQAPYVSQVLTRGLARLDPLADSGQPVDILAAMYDCTMDAIGWTAFGIDLQATARQPGTPPVPYVDNWWHKYTVGSQEFANLLLQSAIGVMRAQNLAKSGVYTPLLLLFPGLDGLIRVLARVLPDASLRQQNKDFAGLREAVKVLINTWRSEQAHKQANGKATANNGMKPSTLVSDQSILARMVSGQDMDEDEKFEDWEVVAHALHAVLAGYETTGVFVAVSLWHLAHHPDVQAKAQQEVDAVLKGKDAEMDDLEQLPYMSAAMMEALRLRPSVGYWGREVSDDEIGLGGGVSVPKGSQVMVPLLSYNLDPSIWPRASEYLPERHIQPGNEHLAPTNPHAYMPFGHGQRICPGYKYAQMEGRMTVARLLQRFSFEPVPGVPDPVFKTSLTFTPDNILLHVKRRV